MMKNHRKKMIAPIVITVLFLICLIAWGVQVMQTEEQAPIVLIVAVVSLALLAAGMVYVLIARIREIRSGEEDDLDNY